NDVYRVAAAGGTPTQVSADRYANEWAAAPSPDGSTLAFVGRGSGLCAAAACARAGATFTPENRSSAASRHTQKFLSVDILPPKF
ncbi:MAG TPA: hypothetical protein VF736_13800, partial [Pyrinomonadaceae bacterium]